MTVLKALRQMKPSHLPQHRTQQTNTCEMKDEVSRSLRQTQNTHPFNDLVLIAFAAAFFSLLAASHVWV